MSIRHLCFSYPRHWVRSGRVLAILGFLVCGSLLAWRWYGTVYRRPHWVFLNSNDSLPQFDADLTWRDYNPWNEGREGTRYEATLVWNGVVVGRGKYAADMVTHFLEHLPRGSRVLIFPRYEEYPPQEPGRIYPEPIYSRKFLDAMASRDLTFIFSPFDDEGKRIPDAFDGKHIPEPPGNVLSAAGHQDRRNQGSTVFQMQRNPTPQTQR